MNSSFSRKKFISQSDVYVHNTIVTVGGWSLTAKNLIAGGKTERHKKNDAYAKN